MHTFKRHDCKSINDPPKDIYLKRRKQYLDAVAKRKFNHLKNGRHGAKNYRHDQEDPDLIHQRKRAKMARESALLEDPDLGYNSAENELISTKDDLASVSEIHQLGAQEAHCVDMVASTSHAVNLGSSAESCLSVSIDSGWAFCLPYMLNVPGDEWGLWAFSE